MSQASWIRSLFLLGAIVMLAPVPANAAATARQAVAKTTRENPAAHPAAPRHAAAHDNSWMMLPVGLAAVGFALRREPRALGALQPLTD